MMRLRIKRNQRGFTLVEAMVVVAISSIIAYAMFAVLRTGQIQSQTAQVKMLIQDSAREGLYKMTQEIRQTAPSRFTITSLGTDNDQIDFYIPDPSNSINGDYEVNWAGAEQVRYQIGGLNNSQVIRENVGTGAQVVIANDVTSLTFTPNSKNTVLTVTIGVQRSLVDGTSVPAQPLQMTAQAELRNA